MTSFSPMRTNVFISYSHKDSKYLNHLLEHLAYYERNGLIDFWSDNRIIPGAKWREEIKQAIAVSKVAVLLISPSFLASKFIAENELPPLLHASEEEGIVILPVIIRPSNFEDTELSNFQTINSPSLPLTKMKSYQKDELWAKVVREIRKALVVQQSDYALYSNQQNKIYSSTQGASETSFYINFLDTNRPTDYIPFIRNPLFQPRPGEFERLETLLCEQRTERAPLRLGLVGVVGMGGVGKTQLAVELAYRCKELFPQGVFWVTATGISQLEWQHQIAELAVQTNFLPPDDDPSHSDYEARRARYICHYLASHSRALLVLDNVEDPGLIVSVLPALAGRELACSVLYTSRTQLVPKGVILHSVEQLPEEGALRLILEDTRPELLSETLKGGQSPEAQAAHTLCQGVGYLPLALIHLQGILTRNPSLKLTRMVEVLKERGALEMANRQYFDAAPLFATFYFSWQRVTSVTAKRLFKLAAFFPEAAPIPLWLLGLATGLGESGDFFEPLGEACLHLRELSLLEELSGGYVRLHPLVREFARRLVAEETDGEPDLQEEAVERIVAEFENLDKLEQRARKEGYWRCLEQVRMAQEYAGFLRTGGSEKLNRIERWLDRESYLLGDNRLWPHGIPGLFYQQLYNRAVEEDQPIVGDRVPIQWMRQTTVVGAEDRGLLRVFTGHIAKINSVAFSPDGKLVLTGSDDGTARLWEANSGKLLILFERDEIPVQSIAFSPDGTKILIGSSDDGGYGAIKLYEVSSGRLLITFGEQDTGAWSVAFSPDGKKVLTGSKDGTATLWVTRNGKPLGTLKGHDKYVTSVAFSPDGKKVLTGSEENGTATLWDVRSRELLWKILSPYEDQDNLTGVAFSPDGTMLLICSHFETVWLWEIASRKLVATFDGASGAGWPAAAFSPDGSKILTVFKDMMTKVWEIASRHPIATFQGHASIVSSVAFSPDGTKILTGSWDHTARLWDIANGKLLDTQEGHGLDIISAAFSPDGTKILTGSWDHAARLWEVSTGKLLAVIKNRNQNVKCVAFSPDGTKFLTGSTSNTARLWEVNSGKLLATLKHKQSVYCVAFSPDGKIVLTGSNDGIARLWEANSGKLLATLKHKQSVHSVAFSPDGTKILIGTWDGTANLWETSSKRFLTKFKGQYGWLRSVAFSPDGMRILTGSNNGTACLWDLRSGEPLVTFGDHGIYLTNTVFSPDGHLVMLCNGHGLVQIWQISEPKASHLLGVYTTTYEIEAVHWLSVNEVMLADNGGSRYKPYFYNLKLEGF